MDVELVTIFSVEKREMPWYYGAADAIILRSDWEGSPTSVKEALACNLPVGATDVGDIREACGETREHESVLRKSAKLAVASGRSSSVRTEMTLRGEQRWTRYDGTRTAERIVELYWAVTRRFRTGEEHRSALRAAGLGVMTPAKKKRTSDKSHSWRGE